jgi:hypothetical protein
VKANILGLQKSKAGQGEKAAENLAAADRHEDENVSQLIDAGPG